MAGPPPPQTGKGKTACVTGASGYIGSHLVKQLAERGYAVRGTVRNAEDESKYGWIKKLADGTSGSIELFSADLEKEGSFDTVVEGCDFVHHVAAVVKFNVEDPKKDVVDPTVEGTRNVLESVIKAKTVKRVVLTSSVVSLFDDFSSDPKDKDKVYTEEDWHRELTLSAAYPMAKTLSERLAWKMAEEHKGREGASDLVVVNPGLVLGELLNPSGAKSSVQFVYGMMSGLFPMAPDWYFSIVHVHDVALVHILAAEKPEAHGRYIASNEEAVSMVEIAAVIKKKYPQSQVPTAVMPTWILYALALFSPSLTVEFVRRASGNIKRFSNRKAREELGVVFIPAEEAILDTAKSLIDWGVVPNPEAPQNPSFLSSFFKLAPKPPVSDVASKAPTEKAST